MGADGSKLESFTSNDIASYVNLLGSNYSQYCTPIVENGVDGG